MIRDIVKKKIVLALVLMLVVTVTTPAFGLQPSPIITEIHKLNDIGKQSNDALDHSVIDLTYVNNGSVVSYTYIGNNEELTVNTFSVMPQEFYPTSTDKLTRFIFELTNRYRPDTDLALSIDRNNQSVHAYTYGTYKHEAMYAIISGIPDCLNNEPYKKDSSGGGGGGSWVDKYNPEETTKEPVTSFVVTTFKLDEPTYTIMTESGTTETKTMDVEPIVKDERTFVPVRYLAYALGADENDINWDGNTKTVTLTINETTEKLTLGSKTLLVNSDPVEMDVAPFAEKGRTFLPARWIAEPVGARVEWDAEKQETIIIIEQEIEKQGN